MIPGRSSHGVRDLIISRKGWRLILPVQHNGACREWTCCFLKRLLNGTTTYPGAERRKGANASKLIVGRKA